MSRGLFNILCLLLVGASTLAAAEINRQTVIVPAAKLSSTLPLAENETSVSIVGFKLDTLPVTNAEFLAFTLSHPEWKRDRASPLFVDDNYLSHWPNASAVNADQKQQPVTRISWFAATAFCEAKSGRLPTWYEWELVAAADEQKADARQDSEWRQKVLNWYARTSAEPIANVGQQPANYYGVKDLHGLVWEWVDDYNGMLVGADNREQNGADKLRFCGAGAVNMEQKENYATLMRIALLSSLEARYTTRNLGFRCAYEI